MSDTVVADREAILRALAHLETIVPSLDQVGSAAATWSREEYEKALAAFINDWDVFKRLSEVRAILSELFDYDELERRFSDVEIWTPKHRTPNE
jgi:hypothetical protein